MTEQKKQTTKKNTTKEAPTEAATLQDATIEVAHVEDESLTPSQEQQHVNESDAVYQSTPPTEIPPLEDVLVKVNVIKALLETEEALATLNAYFKRAEEELGKLKDEIEKKEASLNGDPNAAFHEKELNELKSKYNGWYRSLMLTKQRADKVVETRYYLDNHLQSR